MKTLRNKVNLIGRVGYKPEMKMVGSDYKLTKIAVATNERYKNRNGEWQEDTQWHQVVAWGRLAERLAQEADKGKEIILEGKLINRSYETKEGEKRSVSEIEISEYLIIG